METTYRKHIANSWLIAGILIGIAGLAIGTFFDLPIDQFIYKPDASWARFLAAAAPAPAFWGIGAAGLLLIDVLNDKRIWYIGWIFAFGCLAAGVVYLTHSFMDELQMAWVPAWGISLLLEVLPSLLYWFLMRNTSKEDKLRCIIILLVVCVGSMLVVQVVKRVWMRPRFFVLEQHENMVFSPWYKPDSQAKADFGALYAANSDYFRSFPSGHAQSVTCLFLWALIPVFTGKGSSNLAMALSLILGMVTAASRMVLGAHFLSDVAMGYLITFVIFAICCWCYHLTRGPEEEYDYDDDDVYDDEYDEYDDTDESYDEDEEEPVLEDKPAQPAAPAA